jgi:outer membrane autotransporter protein
MAGTLHRALLNRYALGTALTLVISPFASVDRAMAACSPPSGQNNVTVTCSSNTTNQDGTNGYGQGTEDGVTVNVNSGVTVSGTNKGISLAPAGNSTTTLNNSGTVTGKTGYQAGFTAIVTNSGTITGTDDTAIVTASNLTLTNSGTISGSNLGIFTANITLTNLSTGTIDGAVIAVNGQNQVNVSNAGVIQSSGGIAIRASSSGTLTVSSNTGTISGLTFGIDAIDSANVVNNLNGKIEAIGVNGIAIGSNGSVQDNTITLANAGTVQANGTGGIAVQGQTVNVTSNSGTISAEAIAINAISATGSATVTNTSTGSITGMDGILASTVSVNNAGSITGVLLGVDGTTVTVNNSGTIKASIAIAAQDGTVTNSGTITGTTVAGIQIGGTGNPMIVTNLAAGTITGPTGILKVDVTGTLTVANAGTISGANAIKSAGAAVITNSGLIQSTAGAAGTAIKLSSAADTLNIKNGSSIVGLIDMGHGADVINVDSASPSVAKGVSMLSRATSAVVDALKLQLRNFDGVINIIGGGGSGPVQPSVTANGTTASLDPTALAQQDRALMDFTGGMSSMVQGRLGGAATGSGPQAMSYAMEDARAEMFTKAPAASWSAPVNVWTSAFGATRSQNGTDTTLDSTSSVYGGVIGVDRRIRPDWLVGVFAGGGSGTLNVDLGSQKVSTDYFSGGAYSRFEWASQFFDMTLQAGGINNRSTRLVQNNITGGQEYASASYNGWFVSPEVAYGYHIDLGNGTIVTPTARVRYVAGLFGGYTETGSAQALTIGSRTLQDFEERGEVEVSRTGFLGNAALKGTFHAGVIALQRVGDTNVNAVLIGQSLSFLTPGKSSAVGAVGGAGLDYHVTPNVALFGAIEGMMMSDESRIASAKGGVRVAF